MCDLLLVCHRIYIALSCTISYLSGRTYRVVYAGGTSSVVYIVCSFPQGSVLGPVLFVLYVADLADVINRHGVTLHSFADDTQLYLHCCCEDITTAATRLKECIVDVGRWMSVNRLKLNTEKTELLWTGSRHSIFQLHGHGPSIQWAPILSQLATMCGCLEYM